MLTPAHQAELEEEVVMVGIEDFNHKPVEVVALDAHPGETAQEGEVQEQPPGSADRLTAAGSQMLRDEEGDVQEEDGAQQVHVDVHARDLVSLLASGESRWGDLTTMPDQHPWGPTIPHSSAWGNSPQPEEPGALVLSGAESLTPRVGPPATCANSGPCS